MPEKYHNEGMHISGSTVYGPIAQGSHARATQYGPGVSGAGGDELAAALRELRELIAAHAGSIADPENADRDVEEIESELARPKPDEPRLVDTLARLGRRVAAVGSVASLVARVGELIRLMLT